MLSYFIVPPEGIEPPSTASKAAVLSITPQGLVVLTYVSYTLIRRILPVPQSDLSQQPGFGAQENGRETVIFATRTTFLRLSLKKRFLLFHKQPLGFHFGHHNKFSTKYHKSSLKAAFVICDPGGDRTRDLGLKRPLLYQLSYQVFFY